MHDRENGESEFVAYVGPAELHDARLLRLEYDIGRVTVYIQGYEGQPITLQFHDAAEVSSLRPEGMILYALCEMNAEPPLRRFVFANRDEEDDATLEVIAKDFRVLE